MLRVFLGVLIAGTICGCALAAETAASKPSSYVAQQPIPADPAVRRGVMENGLRFVVMHAAIPKGEVSIRLGIDVGSYEEAEGERGIAHFIEHMAFRNTRSFPDNSVDGALARQGVAFGRDHNASTSLFSTRFQLDLPDATDGEIATGLKWLRDVADGVVFDAPLIDKERGVVLAEKEAEHSLAEEAGHAVLAFEGAELRSFNRDPIGLEPVLRAAGPDQLGGFYRRWYRPDNAVVVMVGDLPLETMEARLRQAFAGWRAEGPPPARAPRQGPETRRELDTFTRHEPSLISHVEVCRVAAPRSNLPQDMEHLRLDALDEVWRSVLNRRLAALRTKPENHLIGAQASHGSGERDHSLTCLIITPEGDAWKPGLAAAEDELLRFQRSGPTDTEVERAVEDVRSRLRGQINDAPNRGVAGLADSLLDDTLEGQAPVEARQRLRAYDLAVEDISVADVRAAFDRDWRGAGPLISLLTPTPVEADELRRQWIATAGGQGLKDYADTGKAAWGYKFAPTGEVVSREVQAKGGFIRFRFKNGVVFNYRQTDFEKDNVALTVDFGEGRRELANSDYLLALMGGPMVALGGTGKHSFDDLGEMFQGDARNFQLWVGNDRFFVGSDVKRPNLSSHMHVLAAYLVDPAFRPSLDPLLHKGGELLYRNYNTSMPLVASEAMLQVIQPDSPLHLPPRSVFDQLDSQKLAAVLKPSMTRDPIEVTLVGDIDEATAIQLVGETFGALPPRTTPLPQRGDTAYLRFPAVAPPPIRTEHQGPADKAMGELVWPLYVATPARRHEEYSLKLLAAVYNNALRQRVRNELGKTYAPAAATQTPDFADQGQFVVAVEAYPADIDLLIREARALAGRMAAGEITAEQLDAARGPMLVSARQSEQSNLHWASALAGSSRDDQNLTDELGKIGDLNAVTLADVKKAAADWLSAAPLEVRVAPAAVARSAQP